MKKIKTVDGSFTLKNDKFNECYHSSEGAVKESLYKHIYPAFNVIQKKEINILDICFGLGYNTFLSVLNRPQHSKLNIFSPEMDEDLIKNLKDFPYPKEFDSIRHIINKISDNFYYEDEFVKIEVFIGDAREYIKKLSSIDIVFQDAFSPKVNKELWSIEYFTQIKNILNKFGIITSYSVATPVRCALYKLGFKLYTHNTDEIRKGTIAALVDLPFERVDFEEKLKRVNCYYYTD
ncbi:tRNA (5-methylaminomethyl-2-thiouridine)(34)-methyltransferase MnmD [Lebetimonas sp. JS032]|uniref:tRNA (5-methylaminomethyl-2-thiouridine)(34)-methyltransferase MnmD n=1 Tax=Lebetimonas sp. JS032 TaxID=990070 RepID=UPI0004AFA8E1|nr:MnmC family methyltransferase [Lebetimonas sp. JS032]